VLAFNAPSNTILGVGIEPHDRFFQLRDGQRIFLTGKLAVEILESMHDSSQHGFVRGAVATSFRHGSELETQLLIAGPIYQLIEMSLDINTQSRFRDGIDI